MAEQITIQVEENKIINVSDVLDSLRKTDAAPTVKGLYFLEEVGNYPNLGLVTQDMRLNYATFDGVNWRLSYKNLPAPNVTNVNNSYSVDPEQIVPSEALYNDETLAGDILQRVDIGSGINGNLKKTMHYFDGTAMSNEKVDGVIYKKIGNDYVVNALFELNKEVNLSTFSNNFFQAINFLNGKGEVKLIINKPINLGGNSFIIPKNITLEFSKGAKILHGIINLGGCKLIDTYQQIFEECEISGSFNDFKGRPEWFGAKNDLSEDCLSSFNQVSKIANNIILSGRYLFSDTWEITGKKGFSIHGEFNQNIGFVDKTEAKILLDFDNIPKDHDGLKISDFVGLSLSNFFVSYYRGTIGGTSTTSNAAVRLFNGHDFKISSLRINALGSAYTSGLILGNNTGETCTFMGTVESVKVLIGQNSIGIGTFGGNTSINFRSCYISGGGYWHIEGTVYSTFLNCACDNAEYYGYLITSNVNYNSTNLSFISCGSESCGKTGFWISDFAQNIDFLNPYESNNNTLNESGNGALFMFSPNTWCKNIKISNPSSYSNNGNYSFVLNGELDNIFIESTNKKNVKKGFGGSALYKASITGDFELQEITASIQGSTVNLLNSLKCYYKRHGNSIDLYLRIDGNVDFTSGSSYIELPFDVGEGIANLMFVNVYDKGQSAITGNKIYLPTLQISAGDIFKIVGKSFEWNKTFLGL